MEEQGMNHKDRDSNILDSELDDQLVGIKVNHSNVGEVMTAGHL